MGLGLEEEMAMEFPRGRRGEDEEGVETAKTPVKREDRRVRERGRGSK